MTRKFGVMAALSLGSLALSGCAFMGADGPSSRGVARADSGSKPSAVVVDIVPGTPVASPVAGPTLADQIGDGQGLGLTIGRGDELAISLFESAPAVLFGVIAPVASEDTSADGVKSGKGMAIANQVVDRSGNVYVPFAGEIRAAGRTPVQIQRDIVARLSGKANRPQAVVRVARNNSAEVAILGDVANTGRFPLTARGDRLLDLVAAAGGGTKSPSKLMVRVEREGRSASMPLSKVIADASQNIRLQAGDVVTVEYQPLSFVAMGAVTRPAEYDFEATGLSLAQALGRIGGLRQDRANVRGVFVFRYEDSAALPADQVARIGANADGRVPVIYRLNMMDVAGVFAARDFALQDKDVVYVSTAPGADLQRLMNAVSSGIFSAVGLKNL